MFNEIKEYSLTIKYFLEKELLSEEQLFVLEYIINTFPEPMLYLGKDEDKEPVYNEDIILLLILLSFVIGQSRENINNLENAQDVETLLDIVNSGKGNNLKNNEILLALLASNLNILDQLEEIDTESLIEEITKKETLLRSQFKLLAYRGTKFALDELFKTYGDIGNTTIALGSNSRPFELDIKLGGTNNIIEDDEILFKSLLAIKPAGAIITIVTAELPYLLGEVNLLPQNSSTINNYDHGWRPYAYERTSDDKYFEPNIVYEVDMVNNNFILSYSNINRKKLFLNIEIELEHYNGEEKIDIHSELSSLDDFKENLEYTIEVPAFLGDKPSNEIIKEDYILKNNTHFTKSIKKIRAYFSETLNGESKSEEYLRENITTSNKVPPKETYTIPEPIILTNFDSSEKLFYAEAEAINIYSEDIVIKPKIKSTPTSSSMYVLLPTVIKPLKKGVLRLLDIQISPIVYGINNTSNTPINVNFGLEDVSNTLANRDFTKVVDFSGNVVSLSNSNQVSFIDIADWLSKEFVLLSATTDNDGIIAKVEPLIPKAVAGYTFPVSIHSSQSNVGIQLIDKNDNDAIKETEQLINFDISSTTNLVNINNVSKNLGDGNYEIRSVFNQEGNLSITPDNSYRYVEESENSTQYPLIRKFDAFNENKPTGTQWSGLNNNFNAKVSVVLNRTNLIKPVMTNLACNTTTGNLTALVTNNNPYKVNVMYKNVSKGTIDANSSKTITFETGLEGAEVRKVIAWFTDATTTGKSSSPSTEISDYLSCKPSTGLVWKYKGTSQEQVCLSEGYNPIGTSCSVENSEMTVSGSDIGYGSGCHILVCKPK